MQVWIDLAERVNYNCGANAWGYGTSGLVRVIFEVIA